MLFGLHVKVYVLRGQLRRKADHTKFCHVPQPPVRWVSWFVPQSLLPANFNQNEKKQVHNLAAGGASLPLYLDFPPLWENRYLSSLCNLWQSKALRVFICIRRPKASNVKEEIHNLYMHIIISTAWLPKPWNTKQNTGEKSVWASWFLRQGTEPSQRRVLKTQCLPQYRIWSHSLCSAMCLRTNWALRMTLEMRENYFVFQLCCNLRVCCCC